MWSIERAVALGALLALGLVACGDDKKDPPPAQDMSAVLDMTAPDLGRLDDMRAPDQGEEMSPGLSCGPMASPSNKELSVGTWRILVDESSGFWEISTQAAPSLKGVAGCEVVADAKAFAVRVATGELFYQELFGQYRFRTDLERMGWVEPEGSVSVKQEGAKVILSYPLKDMPGQEARLVFSLEDRDLRIELETSVEGAQGGEFSMRCDDAEGFFGLGSQSYGMDLRGGKFPLWTQEQGIGKPVDGGRFPINNFPEAAYAPMGIWHSSRGYTALVTHDSFSELDLCKTLGDRVSLRSYKAMPGLVLVEGERLSERLERAAKTYLGLPASSPPDWAFAPWNDAVGGPERLNEVARKLREADIPSSAIWSEDWIGGEQTLTGFRLTYAWEWDPVLYPDLPGDVRALHAQGFAFLGYFNTFVPKPTRMWQEGEQGGYLIKTAEDKTYSFQDPAFRDASLVDLTSSAARDWMRGYKVKAARDLEIDGWMADFSEWMPIKAKLSDGQDPWQYHNRFPVDYQALNRAAMEEVHADAGGGEAANNWLFFSRSGWASVKGGTPSVASILWAGDQDTDWDYDDGLPTVIPIGAHLGLSGVPYYGSDVAGYTSVQAPNTNKELFYRWASVGSLSPVMRTHHGSDKCGNWTFDRDAETTAHYRRWSAIHTLLFPLWRALSDVALSTGLPIMRHPALVEEGLDVLWRGKAYQYFIGDKLLVAPVIDEGKSDRVVYFPNVASDWWGLFASTPGVEGAVDVDGAQAQQATISAPATELPVFVRRGTILPLLPRTVDSFYGASAQGFTDLSSVKDQYALALYPDDKGELEVAEWGVERRYAKGLDWFAGRELDWSKARVGGQVLGACPAEQPITSSCVQPQGEPGVALVGVEGELEVPYADGAGQATLTWGAQGTPGAVTLFVRGMGAAAWGSWAQPTTLTDLDPQIPPPCEDK